MQASREGWRAMMDAVMGTIYLVALVCLLAWLVRS